MKVKTYTECTECGHKFMLVEFDEFTGHPIGIEYCPMCNHEVEDVVKYCTDDETYRQSLKY